MRHYETIFIISPDLPDDERGQLIERYQNILKDRGVEFLVLEEWGRRKLAYEIKKQSKGYYVLFEYASSREPINELERNMRLDENVLRFLTIKKADKVDRAALEARRSQAPPLEDDEEPPHRDDAFGDEGEGEEDEDSDGDEDEGGAESEDEKGERNDFNRNEE